MSKNSEAWLFVLPNQQSNPYIYTYISNMTHKKPNIHTLGACDSYLNDLICALGADTEPLVICSPFTPPPAAFLSSASADFSFLFALFSCFVLFFSPSLFSPWQRIRLTGRPRQQLALRVCSSLAGFINHGSMIPLTVLSTVPRVSIVTGYTCKNTV